jgi:hypothetical protein
MIHPSSPHRLTRFAVGAIAALTASSGLVIPTAGRAQTAPLTNLAHLDWLGDKVTPPAQEGHTTYLLGEEPEIGVLWTYADRQADGTYRRIGGGVYDPATDTWGQGAFNADDISRAAVVYVRHWQQTEAESSRLAAYQLLRGLTYLQTVAGPNAGNVVLWMQPDGTLNPSAEPVEFPDPSDSGPSYWLARTIWALGEAYPAFVDSDPAFAGFLRDRLDLALDAVERQVLVDYGKWLDIDGVAVPAWLIVDGADATGEALLGLASYVEEETADTRARLVLQQLGRGVAAMRSGDARDWPFGAVLPWALSQAVWHAWGGLPPAGLARASEVTGDSAMRAAAVSDAATFTTHLLITAGPENGWLPSPTDRVQIAYGAHSRVESALAAAEAGNRPGLRQVAGIAAAWFFGNNPAGVAMYDPATGRTYDGIEPDGRVNRNSGAESTIHGLLAMLILDGNPDIADLARVADVHERRTWKLVEAESGDLSSRAAVYKPAEAWTGESLWSGGAGVRLRPGGRLTISVGLMAGPNLLMPVVLLDPAAGFTHWRTPRRVAGKVDHAMVGPQGDSPAPGLLAVETLPTTVEDVASVVVLGSKRDSLVDALLVQPEIEHLVLANDSSATALLRSFARGTQRVTITLPAGTTAQVESYDETGRLVTSTSAPAGDVGVTIPAGGFAVVRSS